VHDFLTFSCARAACSAVYITVFSLRYLNATATTGLSVTNVLLRCISL